MAEKKRIAIWFGLPSAILVSGLFCTNPWQASAEDPKNDLHSANTWQSQLLTVAADGSDPKVILQVDELIEAPNWSPDGKSLVYNLKTGLRRIPATGGTPRVIKTGLEKMSNDHVIAPDGKWIYFTVAPHIYRIPFAGGVPKQITTSDREGLARACWLHGISPDGQTLAYCGISPTGGRGDIWIVPSTGGQETQLTSGPGHDDGPDFSSDGKWIYFNSDTSGNAQICRVPVQGGAVEQLTHDNRVNWFPHPSPNGKHLVYLSYPAKTKGHPRGKYVLLRMMPVGGGEPTDLHALYGGQGTINSPSWSPDGSRFAFVRYNDQIRQSDKKQTPQ